MKDTWKRTLLVVEDNELNREVLCALVSQKYNTIEAGDGKEGLELLHQHYKDIALILLDVQMPVMNGYEFLEKVKADPILKTIPVLVTTGSDDPDEEEKCLALGASDFVTKPYRPNVVMSRIGSIIQLRESAATLSMVEYDDLTGIYTRPAFYHHAELRMNQVPAKAFTLIMIDLIDFRDINERYGTQAGNQVLAGLGGFLGELDSEKYLVGRYGGDQFMILTGTEERPDDETIIASLEEFLGTFRYTQLAGRTSLYDDVERGVPMSTLCDRTLTAMKYVKGQNVRKLTKYDEELRSWLLRRHRIIMGMEQALEQEEFRVYYQPKHDAVSGRLVGAEALIRWIHPDYGFMSPADFIPTFEENGFISKVDFFVWEKVCSDLRRWEDAGLRTVPVSVNASKLDFEAEDYVGLILGPVRQHRLPPEKLHIEVTESLFASRPEELSVILQQCRDAGFRIELDDFGSGYSSLNMLGMLPLDIVKLDMSFLRQSHDERRNRVLSGCMLLIRSLGLETVAEGVETEAHVEMMRRLGCDSLQGYYFSKPLPAEEFEAYLRRFI